MTYDALKSDHRELRDLDAAVHKEVMGGDFLWVLHGNTMEILYAKEDGRLTQTLPNYSTNIASAWAVVEKLADETTDFSLTCSLGSWTAVFRGHAVGFGMTPMLAICRAALGHQPLET